jgi:hypothetical protein
MSKYPVLFLSLTLLLLLAVVISACEPMPEAMPPASATATAPAPTTIQPTTTSQPTVTPTPDTNVARPTTAPTPTLTSKTLIPKIEATTPPMLGEAPEVITAAVLKDLSKRTGLQVDALSITIVRSEAIIWNDGSLGCPKPGVFYTQSTVEGYWVVLQVNGKTYDYRIMSRGPTLTLCEK